MSFIEKVTDPYDRKARLTPALIAVLPALVPLVGHYGAEDPVLAGILGLLCGSGILFALAGMVRGLGVRREQSLVKEWGGLPTTICLRHSNNHYDEVTKSRYHKLIEEKLNIKLPSQEEERANPSAADDSYIAASRSLRAKAQKEKGLLLKDNISYGFHRNMLAIKPIGIVISLIVIFYVLATSSIINFSPLSVNILNLSTLNLVFTLTLFISLGLLVYWIFYITSESVKQAGFFYAERLFEYLERLN